MSIGRIMIGRKIDQNYFNLQKSRTLENRVSRGIPGNPRGTWMFSSFFDQLWPPQISIKSDSINQQVPWFFGNNSVCIIKWPNNHQRQWVTHNRSLSLLPNLLSGFWHLFKLKLKPKFIKMNKKSFLRIEIKYVKYTRTQKYRENIC